MGKTIQVYGFPSNVTVDEVKGFLESYTGEGTVYAMKIREKEGPRKYAIVQFTTVRAAEYIISLTNERLWYDTSYLKARIMDNDIISKEEFYVLWKGTDVSVNIEFEMKKLHFFLSHHQVEYKLDLLYENIRGWSLHRRLYGAPRIFEKEICLSSNVFKDPLFNYFKDVPDDQWVRTTDFTPSCLIGHSSALCLELPSSLQLPKFEENFAYYNETEGKFLLQNGSAFSRNLDLVPIVGPFSDDLPYEILFQVNLLVQNGCLPGPALDTNFYKLVDPTRINIVYIEHALEKIYYLKECCYEPSRWLNEQYMKYYKSKNVPKSPYMSLDAGLVYVRRVQITPCKVYFCGPEINISNHVLRHFPEDINNFLRLSLVDEELGKIHSTDLSPRASENKERRTAIYKRFLSILQNGIVIDKKRFEFLAFSSSQLRENSCWMFASRYGLTAADIREWMGNFRQIRNVAKYAARLGQSFSSSTETLTVSRNEMEIIPDVEIERGRTKYLFSDGIGKISAEFATKVALKCGCKGFSPSAFQIRYGGYKGVVAVDSTSSKKLSLRKSMCEYESENTKLDVLAYSKYQPCFLNRQLITLLSTLGIPDHIFEEKQREAVDELDAMLTDPLRAPEALDLMSSGEITNILKEMLLCGYEPNAEPFLSMMLQMFRASKLLDLQTKTRIFLPNGRSMMGCLDETRTLEYGQVFVQFSGTRHRQLYDSSLVFGGCGSHQNFVIEGKVVVAKNPCLHPGDVRVLRAVNVPALHHMVDCVVFPQKGPRPHPNECSGSDLDGDIYFEVEEYFTNYILNDSLGIIANAHTVFADREPSKAMSDPCIELARKFSIAVDFPKTGIPAEIPPHLLVREYPDFMEKADKPTYQSQNVIGKLFREVRHIGPPTSSIKSFTLEVARQCYDPDREVDGFEDYKDDAFYYKSNYDYKLGNYMDYYGIRTEAEILSGNIMKMSKAFTKRRDAEAIAMAVRSLRNEAKSWFYEKGSGLDSVAHDVYAKASAWYHVTYHPNHFLSFPWCVYVRLIQMMRKKIRMRTIISSLECQFSHGLQLS
ncbi:hypothetical protein P3X46_033508 [Hevea brasiliensis]|uniref:RNA-dependent RNA polymerase n=1 Tax=Hevea brasiliensis TaxID=3981 RepID=A0ABQ9KGP9_HEVBR|nr:hypothetical protein P3X46_033508 [Hevea brasiliensis]